MATTPRLGLPLVEAGQAQKHVTHNAALTLVDRLLCAVALDRDLGTPPASPAVGATWIVAAGATGAWAGATGRLATWTGVSWDLRVPATGQTVWVADEDRLYVWTGAAWDDLLGAILTGAGGLQNLQRLGLGTTADAANPFAAKLNAALFAARTVAEGGTGDLRLVLGKEATAGVAALQFRTNWVGRAEIGLVGADDLALRNSADGTTFVDRLKIAGGQVLHDKGTAAAPGIAFLDAPGTGLVGLSGAGLAVATGGVERLRVDATGAVGIGGLGTSRLHLQGNSDSTAALQIRNTTAGATAGLYVSDGSRLVLGQPGGATALVATVPGGRIGIGTAAPAARLHLEGASSIDAALLLFNSSGTRLCHVYPDGADFLHLGAGSMASNGRWMLDLTNGHFRPGLDNSYALGTSSARVHTIYAVNGTINTSDQRDKILLAGLDAKLAWDLIGAVEPRLFRWRVGGCSTEPVVATEVVDEQATEPVETRVERIEVGADGVARLVAETVTVERPLFDRLPVVDADGRPVLDRDGGARFHEVPRLRRREKPVERERVVERTGARVHAGFFAQDVKAALDAAGVDFGVWGLDDAADPASRQWLRPDQLVPVLWAAVADLKRRVEALEAALSSTRGPTGDSR